MTAAATDLEVIEHLDFEPPCQVTYDDGRRDCGSAAAWLVVTHAHCQEGVTYHKLFCPEHYNYMISGGQWRCDRCRESADWRDRIIRTERLKR